MLHGVNTQAIMALYDSGKIEKKTYDSLRSMQEKLARSSEPEKENEKETEVDIEIERN